MSALTSTIDVAGRVAAKTSPWGRPTSSHPPKSGGDRRVRTHSDKIAPAPLRSYPILSGTTPGEEVGPLGRVLPPVQRPRRRPVGGGTQAAVEGGGLPLQRPRIPGDLLRVDEGGHGPGQHQLPLRARGDPLPLRQRRRRG